MAIFGEHEMMAEESQEQCSEMQIRKQKQNQFRAILAFVIHQSFKILTTITHLLLVTLDARQETSKMQRCIGESIPGVRRKARW